MNTNETATAEARIRRSEAVLGALLASASGAAILAHTFGPVPMSFTVPFVVLPSAALLVGVILFQRRHYDRFHAFAHVLMVGAGAGLFATFFYDAIRPLLVWIFQYSFDPYKAMPLFGQLITGRPGTDTVAIVTGWTYHFWNGISFGMMYALFRPKGGILTGWIWAMVLQGLMMWAYPTFLEARLNDMGFLMTGLVGHSVWGIVLGLTIKKVHQRYE